MRYKNIICKYCHKPAIVSTLRKADYCDNCKDLAHNEVARLCYNKNVSTKRQRNLEDIIGEKRKVNSDAANNMNIEDIREIAEEYDRLRLKTIQLYQKKKNQEKYLTKTSDMLSHKLEFDNPSDEEILKMARQVKEDRYNRRQNKISEKMLYAMMNAFNMRSANKFVNEAMQGAKKTRDFDGFLETLKDNEEIYAKIKKEKKY